jgi:FkbM family methyltransferase
MDNVTYSPEMLTEVTAGDALAGDPFMLVDVGCGLGIDDAWRTFGAHLRAHAFDPQIDEIERLAAAEENPHVRYHAAFVGLPGAPVQEPPDSYFEPITRSSTFAALRRAQKVGPLSLVETNDWQDRELSDRTVGLADFLRSQGVERVDFVKIDTDGNDLNVLRSVEELIEPSRMLGFMVETPFTGPADDSAHTFRNVDRLLKRHGFLLCTLSVERYSRAALPGPFTYSTLAQTVWGQAMWGDLVYLRDGAHPDYARFGDLSPTKLLKLACLYELFLAPDCAAEILITHRSRLAPLVDIDRLLDLLTPELNGRRLSYREYLRAFEEDPLQFYPQPAPEPVSPTAAQRAKHLVAHALGRTRA